MESKPEKNLITASDPKKENPMSRIVIENFSDWDNFKRAVKGAWENIDYDPRENKFTRLRFTREILQNNADKIGYTDLVRLSSLAIKEIDKPKRHKEKAEIKSQEKSKSVKEKYVQREMPFEDKEDKIIFKSRDKDLSKDIDKILYH